MAAQAHVLVPVQFNNNFLEASPLSSHMNLSLRKATNIIVEEFGVATCDISERCFFPLYYTSCDH